MLKTYGDDYVGVAVAGCGNTTDGKLDDDNDDDVMVMTLLVPMTMMLLSLPIKMLIMKKL